jgi:hypothetical protein
MIGMVRVMLVCVDCAVGVLVVVRVNMLVLFSVCVRVHYAVRVLVFMRVCMLVLCAMLVRVHDPISMRVSVVVGLGGARHGVCRRSIFSATFLFDYVTSSPPTNRCKPNLSKQNPHEYTHSYHCTQCGANP